MYYNGINLKRNAMIHNKSMKKHMDIFIGYCMWRVQVQVYRLKVV